MASPKMLDTHIHLWPGTSVSPTNHGWMTPGHFLAKRHGISDYNDVTSTSSIQPSGFIYVETDRYLPDIYKDELSDITRNEGRHAAAQKLAKWAQEPLEELKFLRRIAEGKPEEGDGFEPTDSSKMVGCVIWAPFHLPTELFDIYLEIAEEVSGPRLWQRVVGFRYLMQAITDETTLRTLLESQDWLHNILRLRSGRSGKGWAFDIGVDSHGVGVWQVEAAADMVKKVRAMEGERKEGRVRFVLNHLCKPDLSTPSAASSSRWLDATKRLAAQPAVYMKLSGGFNEFAPSSTPSDLRSLIDRLDFYARNVFTMFGSQRTMFGSDWPVCNVGGPIGAQQNWKLWQEVVAKLVEECGGASSDVWQKTGCEVYGVEG